MYINVYISGLFYLFYCINFTRRYQLLRATLNLSLNKVVCMYVCPVTGLPRLPGRILCCVNIYGLLTKCEVKMAGYWPTSFACLWTEREWRSIKLQKKRMRPISSHLYQTSLVNKGFAMWLLWKFLLRDTAGSPEQAR